MNSGKVILASLFTAAFAGTVYGIVKVTHTANAAGKLDANIESASCKEIKRGGMLNLPMSVIYSVKITLKNPTNDDVEISQPYIKVSAMNKSKNYQKVATTAIPSSEMLNIKGKQVTTIIHDIEVKLQDVLPIVPGIISYVLDKLAGNKASISGLVEFTADALGVTISDKLPVTL